MTLTPAYGRDYVSAKAVKAAWDMGADFTVADIGSRWYGSKINRAGAMLAEIPTVNIRYRKLAAVTVIKVGTIYGARPRGVAAW